MTADAAERIEAGQLDQMMRSAGEASRFLKALSNENRLLLLCLLSEGEKSVGELEQAIGLHQSTISQHLARLRHDRLVATRRAGKTIYYRLASEEARRTMELLYEMFCEDQKSEARSQKSVGR